jgi:hypothetical protein
MPEHEWSLTGLASRTGASVSSVQREITRAEQAGVVNSRRLGAAGDPSPKLPVRALMPGCRSAHRDFGDILICRNGVNSLPFEDHQAAAGVCTCTGGVVSTSSRT